ncbi:MAG: phage holin family protein [Candidatus Hydrothermota bacterium]|nr:MAG: phage holin family protein [Candidatus Hydrothermae bacterium]
MLARLLLKLVFNAAVLAIVDYILPSVSIQGFWPLFWAALLLAIVNAVLRPILQLIALPLTVLTLGLFAFVVNGFLLYLVSAIVPGFEITSFWAAVLAAILIAIVSTLLGLALKP